MNENMNENMNQPVMNEPTAMPMTPETPSHMVAYIIAIVVVVVAALGFWYLYMYKGDAAAKGSMYGAPAATNTEPKVETQVSIDAEINAIANESAGLDSASAAAAAELSGF